MTKIKVLGNKQLAPFLKRHMAMVPVETDLRLDTFLELALEKANEFVPSESGSIFLDDPAVKMLRSAPLEDNELAAVACFGPRTDTLLGRKIAAHRGIVGRVYGSGQAYYSRDVRRDPHFSNDFDLVLKHRTRSVLCVPIRIRASTIGVLELVNKKGRTPYTLADFELLQIFADYISASIQNFLDAKRNSERAKKDNLTGLSNDRQLHIRLQSEMRRAARAKGDLALIFIDLDHFKEINDEHGHLAGSRVLYEVGEVLRECVRLPKAELARYGGDEYVVLIPGTSVTEAVSVAEDIRRGIASAVFLSVATPEVPALRISDQITASIGVACLKAHVGVQSRGGGLIRAADEAMYLSKREGKDRVSVARPPGRKRPSEVTQ